MEKIDFSVVVPFCNNEKTLEACIRSLLAQEYPVEGYEIICVNNNSTDNSCLLVNRYPGVKLIHEKRQGAYAARNAGILESRGAFIVFTDADVKVKDSWLRNIYFEINKNNYDILIGWYNAATMGRLLQFHSHFISERIKKALEQKSISMLTANACNLIVRRDIFKERGLFLDILRGEDRYFIIRRFEEGYRIGFSEDIEVVRNDIHSVGIALLKNFVYGYANAVYIKRKVPLSENIPITIRFAFRHFPVGMGLLMFVFFYGAGYLLGKTRCCLKPYMIPKSIYETQ